MKYHITADHEFECSLDYSLRGTTKSFKEEVADHIKNVVKGYDEVYLLFSGGMDSRFLSLLLMELGIDFTAITYAFSPNFDDYDSRASKDFSKRHGFKHELFHLELKEFADCIKYHNDLGFSFPALNTYYVLTTLRRYNQPNRVFLTGVASEFLIENKKVDIRWVIYVYQTIYPNIHNFTTDRILFSYLDEPIIKDNWQDLSLGRFYLRNKVYGSIYPDKLKSLKKRGPDHQHMVDYFMETIVNKQGQAYFDKIKGRNFTIDLETYYNGGSQNGS